MSLPVGNPGNAMAMLKLMELQGQQQQRLQQEQQQQQRQRQPTPVSPGPRRSEVLENDQTSRGSRRRPRVDYAPEMDEPPTQRRRIDDSGTQREYRAGNASGGINRIGSKSTGRRQKQQKPQRRQPGVAAVAEIIKLQKTTKLLIPRAPFFRVVREIALEKKKDCRFQSDAVEALRQAAEYYLIQYFEDLNTLREHRNRVTLAYADHYCLMKIYAGKPNNLFPVPGLTPQQKREEQQLQKN